MAFLAGLRYAVRSYARAPGLAFALVLTIAIGVGGNAAVFGFIGGLIARTAADDPDAAASFSRMAVLLTLASGLVLVLACASVAGLLLSRASGRARETAVRVALGATRRGLGLLYLADILVVVLIGSAIGAVVAWWVASLFPLLFYVEDAQQLAMAPDPIWLSVAVAAWIAVMVLCGMAPILTVSHRDPSIVLRRDAMGLPPSIARLRRRLVIAQIAACIVVVVLAGVVRQDLRDALRTSRGAVVGELLVVGFQRRAGGYFAAVEKRVTALPGVTGTAWMSTLPGGRAPTKAFAIDPPVPMTRELLLDVSTLDTEALPDAWRTPLAGRMFVGGDQPGGCPVALINEEAADRYFDGDAADSVLAQADGSTVQIVGVIRSDGPPGKRRPALYYYTEQVAMAGVSPDTVFYAAPRRTRSTTFVAMDVVIASPSYFDVLADPPTAGAAFAGAEAPGACRIGVIGESAARDLFEGDAVGGALIGEDGGRIRIVGVVGADALGAAQRTAPPVVIVPSTQNVDRRMFLAIRTNDSSASARRGIDDAIIAVPGGAPLAAVTTLDEYLVATSLAPARVAAGLIAVCAALALVLSIAGIQGAMAEHVAKRRRELALRIALGARGHRLVAQVLREGARLASVGAGIGLVLATAGAPMLGRFVLRPRLPEPAALAIAFAAALVIVGVACAVPAWRAVRVDPRGVLQSE